MNAPVGEEGEGEHTGSGLGTVSRICSQWQFTVMPHGEAAASVVRSCMQRFACSHDVLPGKERGGRPSGQPGDREDAQHGEGDADLGGDRDDETEAGGYAGTRCLQAVPTGEPFAGNGADDRTDNGANDA